MNRLYYDSDGKPFLTDCQVYWCPAGFSMRVVTIDLPAANIFADGLRAGEIIAGPPQFKGRQLDDVAKEITLEPID